MRSIRLGVNIDHVATVRNARGENYPSPLRAALLCEKYGANSVTIHLREDRRHIRDFDLKVIKKKLKIPLNLEIAPVKHMVKISLKYKPDYVCIVPEKRREITTEGGLNLKRNFKQISKIVKILNKNRIRTSLFINPTIKDVKISKDLNVNCIELHTGRLSNLIKKKRKFKNELTKIKNSSKYADKIGLEVHAGHGMDYKTTKILSKINEIKEFNIGHFIIGESIFDGLKNVIKKIKKKLK